MTKAFFGTDGIRGPVGKEPITPSTVTHLGWALGCVVKKYHGRSNVLIGKDTRISGYLLESAMEAGLSAAGVNVTLLGPLPTPAIAYLTQTARAGAGVVISASHNHYSDNGIKFFSAEGTKISDQVQSEIEALMSQPMQVVESEQLGKAYRMDDAVGRYVEFCKGTIPRKMSFKGLKVAIDCANGAAYQCAPAVFEELGAEVFVINNSPDGFNINQACGSTHPQDLRDTVLEYSCDIGIAFDGDADRVVMVDQNGNLVDGDQLIFVIANSLKRQRRLQGGVVGTLMTNLGIEAAFAERDIPFVRAKVGDRYVLQELEQRGWALGGESSGHIICLDKTTTGDGLISALRVVTQMRLMDESLSDMVSQVSLFPQKMVNVKLNDDSDAGLICQAQPVQEAVSKAESDMLENGRVLLRPSGTEPVIRVMVEAKEQQKVTHWVDHICQAVEQQL
jgi:phosphoglucosamine mutase